MNREKKTHFPQVSLADVEKKIARGDIREILFSESEEGKRPAAWKLKLEAVLRESDGEQLRKRVEAAESAIFMRLQALVDKPKRKTERQALQDGMVALRRIQTEKLNYPDWKQHPAP